MSCSTSRMPTPRSATTRFRIWPNVSRLPVVEPGRGLVEQQHAERAGQAARQLDQAALPGREGAGLRVLEAGEAAQLEQRPGERQALLPFAALGDHLGVDAAAGLARLEADEHVVEHAEGVEQLHLLERPAEAGPRPRRGGQPGHVPAAQPDLARTRCHQARARVEDGGLARAVGADEPGDPARRRGEGQAVDRDETAEPDRQPIDFQGHGRRERQPRPFGRLVLVLSALELSACRGRRGGRAARPARAASAAAGPSRR